MQTAKICIPTVPTVESMTVFIDNVLINTITCESAVAIPLLHISKTSFISRKEIDTKCTLLASERK